jgi:hypothetical protein
MATNLLLDCTCSFVPGGADDGEFTAGTPISFKADEIEVNETIDVVPHETAQDAVEMNRKRKQTWTATVRTKLYSSALLAAVMGNDLGRVVVTAQTGRSVTFTGVITARPATLGIPSTLEFTLSSYGTLPVWS